MIAKVIEITVDNVAQQLDGSTAFTSQIVTQGVSEADLVNTTRLWLVALVEYIAESGIPEEAVHEAVGMAYGTAIIPTPIITGE